MDQGLRLVVVPRFNFHKSKTPGPLRLIINIRLLSIDLIDYLFDKLKTPVNYVKSELFNKLKVKCQSCEIEAIENNE